MIRLNLMAGMGNQMFEYAYARALSLQYHEKLEINPYFMTVAAHECGHAIQHAKGYAPISIRSALVPFANWGSRLSWILIIAGLFIGGNSSQMIIDLGIWAFSLAVLFQLVTLPVEFNASSRAMQILESTGILGTQELQYTRKVLSAAAMTYVAAAASSILQLLRLIVLFGGGRRRDD